MNLAEIRKYLAEAGVQANKKFSQNFLFNDDVLHRIIDLVPAGKGFYVEIGGGLGSLTEKAVRRGLAPFTVADLDENMLNVLRNRFSDRAYIVFQDGAKIDFSQYYQGTKGYVFGNLPYQVSSLIMMNTCFESRYLDGAVFLLQKEVAQKFAAAPQTRDFGPIAALIRLIGHAECVFTVHAEDFYPAPKVESAVLKVTFNDHGFSREELSSFADTVRMLFSNRRKTLQNVFKINCIDAGILNDFGDITMKRAEELDWETILEINEKIGRRK
ncbi:ribosomal RNA small subunit methyltransferase A [bacterium]|nr:ribosomal RNA small subunit methyltransferase A [bacterium]